MSRNILVENLKQDFSICYENWKHEIFDFHVIFLFAGIVYFIHLQLVMIFYTGSVWFLATSVFCANLETKLHTDDTYLESLFSVLTAIGFDKVFNCSPLSLHYFLSIFFKLNVIPITWSMMETDSKRYQLKNKFIPEFGALFMFLFNFFVLSGQFDLRQIMISTVETLVIFVAATKRD